MRRGLAHLVSDHAVVRWIERVEGINVEAIREHIMAHSVLSEVNSQRVEEDIRTHVQHPNGTTVVVRGGRVITVLTEEGQTQ